MSHRIHLMTSAIAVAPEDNAGVRPQVVFDYDPADPLAVTLTLSGIWERATWVVSRDLLRDGLDGTSGPEDVSAWSGADNPDRYYLLVRDESVSLVFCFPGRDVSDFLDQTYCSVPADAEFQAADLDAELNAILGEAA
jgi:hypothetical protein